MSLFIHGMSKVKKIIFILLAITVVVAMYSYITYKNINSYFLLTLFLVFSLSILYLLSKKESIYFDIVIICLLLGSIILFPYLSGNKMFSFNNDQFLQYEYFYDQWFKMIKAFIKNRTMPFYTFNSFLGSDFFSSKLYYVTGDIFVPLIIIFKSTYSYLMYQSLLLIVLSSLFFGIFLKKFGIKNDNVIIVSSLIYAFCGGASIYLGQYMFHRFYTFLPLLLAGVEVYRQNKKISLFIIATALCFLSSYYFMFSTSVYLVLYYIFTKYYHEDIKISAILKSSIKLIIAYFIGLFCVAFLLVPGILFVLNNPRVGSDNSFNLFYEIQVYIGYIMNFMVSPLTLFSKYPFAYTSGNDGHLTWYSFYVSSIAGPIICGLFFKNSNKKNNHLRWLILVMIISSLLPPLSSIFHGLSGESFRWMFLVGFTILLIYSVIFDNFSEYKENIIKGFILYLIILSITMLAGFIFKVFDINVHKVQLLHILGSFILMISIISLIKLNKKERALLFCVLEVILMFTLRLRITGSEYGFYDNSLDRYTLKYLDEKDGIGLYRMYANYLEIAPFIDTLNLNQSLHYGYRSAQTYDTTYETNLKEYLEANDINWHIINIDDMENLRMLGLKYYYVTSDNDLPQGYDFTYIINNYHWKVYELNNYRPIGFTYTNFTNDINEVSDNNLWNDLLYINNEDYYLVKDIKNMESKDFIVREHFDDNNIKGNITLDSKQVLFFSIPYNESWRIKDNGETIKPIKVQGGFIGLILDEGHHEIELNYVPKGFKVGCILSAIGISTFIVILYLEKRKNA